MRPRAGSWFPCSPQLLPEQAANRVVVSRVSTDVGERTPMARDCNSHLTQLLNVFGPRLGHRCLEHRCQADYPPREVRNDDNSCSMSSKPQRSWPATIG